MGKSHNDSGRVNREGSLLITRRADPRSVHQGTYGTFACGTISESRIRSFTSSLFHGARPCCSKWSTQDLAQMRRQLSLQSQNRKVSLLEENPPTPTMRKITNNTPTPPQRSSLLNKKYPPFHSQSCSGTLSSFNKYILTQHHPQLLHKIRALH